VRNLGGLLKAAASSPAYNVNQESLKNLVAEIRRVAPELAERTQEELLREVRVAPTLVKYADPNPYEVETRRELKQAAAEMMRNAAVEQMDSVDLLDDDPLEIELATTLLYEHCHFSYRQVRAAVEAAGEKRRNEIIDLGLEHRGRHDEMLRPYCSGQRFRFDILMDIGGFRDMHRHRRCIQIGQGFTVEHGYEVPDEVGAAGQKSEYDAHLQKIASTVRDLARRDPESAQYAIPLGFRKRTLFKMDFAEAAYISELRTGPAGHISYRKVAYAMYEAVARRYPSLAKHFRVTDVREPVDLLKR
jgi:thymidylate synthase ThyX